MKKRIALLLVAILAISMLSLSAGAEEAAKWDTTKNDEIVLSVMNNYYTQGWYTMAEKYHELHPETTVTIDVIANNDALSQKFVTWFSSDDLSDASDITHINFAGSAGGVNMLQSRGQVFDFSTIMDEINPYTGVAVGECFDPADVSAYTTEYGIYALPFDHVGVAVIVNTDMLAEYGIEVPTTQEEWIAACETLKQNGIDSPIVATAEAGWYIAALGDAVYRDEIGDYIYTPDDEGYDAELMPKNADYVYDPEDLSCDVNLVINSEALAIAMKETEFDTPRSRSLWAEYAKIGKYFNENWMDASSTEVLTSFETGEGAFLVSGSWNVGVLNADMLEMGDDAFNWITIPFPSFETTPAEWSSGTMRSLYGMGNTMGIIITGDEDHTARVVDFFEFCYNPENCAIIYDVTLASGQFIQGPVAIKGVDLGDELNAKLEGFITECSINGSMAQLAGHERFIAEDSGTYKGLLNQLDNEEITSDEFVDAIKPIAMRWVDNYIAQQGFDLDRTTKDVK